MTTVELRRGSRRVTAGARPRSVASAAWTAEDALALRRRLRSARTTKELLTLACDLAAGRCHFERALVLSVHGYELTADAIGALMDPAGDTLRRAVLAAPIALVPHSAEAQVIRATESGQPVFPPASVTSVVRAACGLEHVAFGAVMPEDAVLALLVVDRPSRPVEREDWERVQQFALLVSSALESLILRLRMQEFSDEIRHMGESARALVGEALHSPLTLPTDFCAGSSFASSYPALSGEQLSRMFTHREFTILEGLVAGRSNPEIAADLQLSRETVKKYTARVMRKLGATSRADAAVRYVRLASTNA